MLTHCIVVEIGVDEVLVKVTTNEQQINNEPEHSYCNSHLCTKDHKVEFYRTSRKLGLTRRSRVGIIYDVYDKTPLYGPRCIHDFLASRTTIRHHKK
jgi:hypothetical protein